MYRFLRYLSCTLVASALTDGANGNPPGNMRRVTIMWAILVTGVALSMMGLEGKQVRRRLDEENEGD